MIELLMEEYILTGLRWVVIGAWRALPLTAIVLLVDLVSRKRISARFHCVLWVIVIVRMSCPVSAPSSFSIQGPMRSFTEFLASERVSDSTDRAYEDLQIDSATNSQPWPTEPAWQKVNDESGQAASGFNVIPNRVSYNAPTHSEPFNRATAMLYGMAGIWLVVALGVLFRGVVQYVRFAVRLRKCPEIVDQHSIDEVLRTCDALQCRRRPKLKEVDSMKVPAVFGLFRHTICLPPGTLQQLSSEEFRWVLRHEIAHITRRDSLVLSLALFVRAWHWFHPLAWLSVSRLRRHMEVAADDVAMRSASASSIADYGKLLVRYASAGANRFQPAAVGLLFASAKNRLRQRIELLDGRLCRDNLRSRSLAAVIIVLIAVCGLTDATTADSQQPPLIHIPEFSVSSDRLTVMDGDGNPGEASDEPQIEVTYKIRDVVKMLNQTLRDPDVDPESYIIERFNPYSRGSATITKDRLIVKQTEKDHQLTSLLLRAWARSGAWTIDVDCCIIVADPGIASDLDWLHQNVSTYSGQRPALAVSISETQRRRLLNRAQKHVRCNVAQAPKVKLQNGQRALICDEIQRPFVTGIRPGADKSSGPEPVIQVVSEGWRMQIHAEVTELDSVELHTVVTHSRIHSVQMANLPFSVSEDPTATVTVQVPHVLQSTARSRVDLQDGESLLIASPATFSAKDSMSDSRTTFYMITPHAVR